MTRYRKASPGDWRRTAVYIGLYVALVIGGAVLWLPDQWYLWLLLVAGGLVLLVRWHARRFAYRCGHCGHEFEISAWTDLASPQGIGKEGGWKLLRCPRCGERSRAVVIKKAADSSRLHV
jgi:DNA-directed RNA polymerase subunit RPC12/RpoP